MSGPGDVTVVIPVWDRYVEFLPAAVESVRRTARDTPIVVVDNASAVQLPALGCCEIVKAPSRLSVGAARNLGLEQVESEYVVFLDADDMLLDSALEFMLSRIAADPQVAIAAMSILDGATGERHRTPRRFAMRVARWRRSFALANSIWSLLPIQGCAIMRTEQARDAGGYPDADFGDDWVLGVSLAWRGRVEVSERLGRYYRLTEGSITGRIWDAQQLRGNARLVRARIRRDPGVPAWARALIPAIALLQLFAIFLARPAYGAIRALCRPPSNVR